MSADVERYRGWLWTYDREWRATNADAVLGVMADAADAGERPGWRDWLSLAAAGIRTRSFRYVGGVRTRTSIAGRSVRNALSTAAVPAVVSAVMLLSVDLLISLVGTPTQTRFVAGVTDLVWVSVGSGTRTGPSISPIGVVALIAAVAALVATARRAAPQVIRGLCLVGAASAVLAFAAAVSMGVESSTGSSGPASGTGLAAAAMLLIGACTSRKPTAPSTAMWWFGAGGILVLAFGSGLLGATLDIGVLNSAPIPLKSAIPSLYLLFCAAWWVAAATDRPRSAVAVGALAITWWAGLYALMAPVTGIWQVRQFTEAAVIGAVVVALWVLIPRGTAATSEVRP